MDMTLGEVELNTQEIVQGAFVFDVTMVVTVLAPVEVVLLAWMRRAYRRFCGGGGEAKGGKVLPNTTRTV